jgi:hypothetical protein
MPGMTFSQTTGGVATFNFLKLPPAPMQSAVGGVNVSLYNRDAGLATNNPALLHPELHGEVAFSFNSFFAGSKAYHLTGIQYLDKKEVTVAGSIFYVDHGNMPETDAAGNRLGNFHPREFVIQASASKSYLDRWRYGGDVKIARASYGQYGSTALLFDAGILYRDTAAGFSAGLLARNMGVQLSAFGSEREDMPFDLQAGLTKKLAKAPFAFSVTLQQMHRFRLGYNDSTFNRDNGFPLTKSSFGGNFFNHFVFATHIYLSPNLDVNIGYNRLRRAELNAGANGNGINGFSAGLRARFKKIQFQFARAWYQSNYGYNQVGLGVNLKELSAL